MSPITFDNSYARLPEQFYARQAPVPVTAPGPIRVNRQLAEQLGIDANWLSSEAGIQVIAGNVVASGSEPLASVYARTSVWRLQPTIRRRSRCFTR